MSTGDKEPKPKTSFDELIKSNVALWFLGAVTIGFSAGIGAVKWSDERYKVEPIPIVEREALVKAQSDLVTLRKAYKDLESRNAELEEARSKQNPALESRHSRNDAPAAPAACLSQSGELDSLKKSYARSQADLTAALKSCRNTPAVSAAGGTLPSPLSQITVTLNYARRRLADANLISNRLGPQFKDLQLVACTVGCNHTAQINYGYDLSAPIAFSVARLLTQAGVAEFSQPMITQGESPHKMTIYLAD